MTVEMFTTMMLAVSGLTALFVEGLKTCFTIKTPNVAAIVVSCVLSVLIGFTYIVSTGDGVTFSYVITMVWLMLLSSLCAMVGYDKVIQLVKQIGAN